MSQPIQLPSLPADPSAFITYVNENSGKSIQELVQPYKDYEAKLREVYAQQPEHPATADPLVNLVPIFTQGYGEQDKVNTRARNLDAESEEEKEKYILPLAPEDRRGDGAPATVQSLKDFQTNFGIFSESSLAGLDWSNVAACGSSVVTSLMPVPDKYNQSKRTLREYYHEIVAPASDVDLFLYGLTEEEAIEKVKQIERSIRDAVLTETTTIRTKNAITIVSQYPTRHVQIVLRIYSSISEMLTGFDVDCACAAYDGKQVYASPRALASYITQINSVDLTRRSPSYENRLSKYSHRGFEVYWPQLERDRVDPTIFERSFTRTMGLARLLVLERLPKECDREQYIDQRRRERGRPSINRYNRFRFRLRGNIKNDAVDEVAEWVEGDELSNYNTFSIPYGPKYTPKKIEKLLYTKDLLLNAEWNQPKDRGVYLHRHPAFFGFAEDVMSDCCGFCPDPVTDEEMEVAEEEQKYFVSGNVQFLKDDPGRQAIGSFHPITDTDWTEMAYVGNVAGLFNAIVDHDLHYVQEWFKKDGSDPNQRDHTGKTPLQLATLCSTVEIVQCLIDNGARLVARMVDGRTALHLAAQRGSASMIKAILQKSEQNEEEQMIKEDATREAKQAANNQSQAKSDTDSDFEEMDEDSNEDQMDTTTENSFVKVKSVEEAEKAVLDNDNSEEPDVFDVNVVAWDSACSPLHLAIINGHTEAATELVSNFGADVLIPVKLVEQYDNRPRGAILNLVLAKHLPIEHAKAMVKTLLDLGASSAQADTKHVTALQYLVDAQCPTAETVITDDQANALKAIKHLSFLDFRNVTNCLESAIKNRDLHMLKKLVEVGSPVEITFEDYVKMNKQTYGDGSIFPPSNDPNTNKGQFRRTVSQPIIKTAVADFPEGAIFLIQNGVDVNTLTTGGHELLHDNRRGEYMLGETLLDLVRIKIKELKSWSRPTNLLPKVPEGLKSDHVYLSGFRPGTYSHWRAKVILHNKKEYIKAAKEQYNQAVEEQKKPGSEGLLAKEDAISKLIMKFEELETLLVRNGAMTFHELYPNIPPPEKERESTDRRREHHESQDEWSIDLSFRRSNITDTSQEAYIEIFDAAWNGSNMDTIKGYTLGLWEDGESQHTPLQIATSDPLGINPCIASLLQGHFEFAKGILEIAHAQYQPSDEKGRKVYQTRAYYDSEEASDSDSDDDIQIYGNIVDEQFTVENIGEVQNQVRSSTSAPSFLKSIFEIATYLKEQKREGVVFSYEGTTRYLEDVNSGYHDQWRGANGSLIEYAIITDDEPLFTFIMASLAKFKQDTDSTQESHLTNPEYRCAMRYGSPRMISRIIESTGGGVPLNEMMKNRNIEIKDKPRYYQGLSVYGRKRRDWAEAGHSTGIHELETTNSPLLAAAAAGNLQATEWFMTDEPLRQYCKFASRKRGDKRVQSLSRMPGGVERAMKEWLSKRNDMLIHCAILAKLPDKNLDLLKFAVSKAGAWINAQTPREGRTPLALAFSLCRPDIARMLISAGADQQCRDFAGNNLLHYLLVPMSYERIIPQNLRHLKEMLGLIEPELLQTMFVQRCADNQRPRRRFLKPGKWTSYNSQATATGPLTPLAKWLTRHSRSQPETELMRSRAVLRKLLEVSRGAPELEMFDGAGDTPLHHLIGNQLYELVDVVLGKRPELLWYENATGRTPLEMAEDAWLAEQVANPPDMQVTDRRTKFYGGRNGHDDRPAVLDENEHSFAKSATDELGLARDKTPVEKTWRVCQMAVEKQKEQQRIPKRKLVSLFDANEVARRLARKPRTPDTEYDVVEGWYDLAAERMESDLPPEADYMSDDDVEMEDSQA